MKRRSFLRMVAGALGLGVFGSAGTSREPVNRIVSHSGRKTAVFDGRDWLVFEIRPDGTRAAHVERHLDWSAFNAGRSVVKGPQAKESCGFLPERARS